MNGADWHHLTEWYGEWLEADGSRRAHLREQLARERPALVAEADALARSSESLPGFLETPAFVLAAQDIADHTLTLSPDDRLGPYRIVGLLGHGGMGDVYRAIDVRLDRQVALKLMTHPDAPDGRVDRFLQEARVTAALDHPNIVKVFDVGVFEGHPYFVAELVEGETLRARLAAGALDPRVACRLASQVARGLVAAHAVGLVHRDLKPENIVITRSGDAKILDFGIAKLADDPLTRDGVATLSGVLMGTAGYLAPEQIVGAAFDGRADLFALGSMLFEMLTGERAFARAHVVDTLHAILHDPPPEGLRSKVPPRLAAVVERLLEKDPSLRFQSAADLAWALDSIDSSADEAVPRVASTAAVHKQERARGGAGAVRVCVGGRLDAARRQSRWWIDLVASSRCCPDTRRRARGTVHVDAAGRSSLESAPVVSPDHARLVFVGAAASGRRLFVRELSSLDAVAIPGTEGARQPFWSPDGQSIGFFAGGKLMKVALSGGAPIPLADAPDPRGGAWNAAGIILFQPLFRDSALYRVSSAGGAAEPVTQLDETGSDVSRNGQFFSRTATTFFQVISLDDSRRGVYLGRLGDPAHRAVLLFRSETGPNTCPWRTGEPDSSCLRWVTTSRCVGSTTFPSPCKVMRAGCSSQRRATRRGAGRCSARLATCWLYSSSEVPWGAHPAAMDLDGGNMRMWPDAELGGWLRLSPDGGRLLRAIVDPQRGNPDIWVEDLARGTTVRVTRSRDFDVSPVWSTDGRRVAFRTGTVGKSQLALAAADGTGSQSRLPCPTDVCEPTDWSPDGRLLVVNAGDDVWTVSADGSVASAPLLAERFVERDARFSPDGRWLAYVSDESGRAEVSVRSLSGPPIRVVASSGGGDQPVWGRNGSELYYLGTGGILHSVSMREAGTSNLAVGIPKALNVPPLGTRHWGTVYDVSHQGTPRLFLPLASRKPPAREIGIVLNWMELDRK